MGENANIQFTFTAKILLGRNTSRFDRRCTNPSTLGRLKAEVAQDNVVASGRLTFYTTSLAFFDALPVSALAPSVSSSLYRPWLIHT